MKTRLLAHVMIFFSVSSLAGQQIREYRNQVKQLDNDIAYLRTLYASYGSSRHEDCSRQDKPEGHYISPQFHHHHINECLKKVNELRSLEPFFAMWDDFMDSDQCDASFLEECALLTVIFYNHVMEEIIQDARAQDLEGMSVDEIIVLYEKIASMSIGQLLFLLEDVIGHIATFLEKSGVVPRLFAWLGFSWWRPALMVGSYVFHWLIKQA